MIIRIIGDEWFPSDKVVLSVVEFKPIRVAMAMLKKKIDVDVTKYHLWPVADGRRADRSQGPFNKEKSWSDQFVTAGCFIYVSEKQEGDPEKPEGPSRPPVVEEKKAEPETEAAAATLTTTTPPPPPPKKSVAPPPPPPKHSDASGSTPPPPPPRPNGSTTATATAPPPPPPPKTKAPIPPVGSTLPLPSPPKTATIPGFANPTPDVLVAALLANPPTAPATPLPTAVPQDEEAPPPPPPVEDAEFAPIEFEPSAPTVSPPHQQPQYQGSIGSYNVTSQVVPTYIPVPTGNAVTTAQQSPAAPQAVSSVSNLLNPGSNPQFTQPPQHQHYYHQPPPETSGHLQQQVQVPQPQDFSALKNELAGVFIFEIRALKEQLAQEREGSRQQVAAYEGRVGQLEATVKQLQEQLNLATNNNNDRGCNDGDGTTHPLATASAASPSLVVPFSSTSDPVGHRQVPVFESISPPRERVQGSAVSSHLNEKRAALATTVSLYEFARSEVDNLRIRQQLEKERHQLSDQLTFERKEMTSMLQQSSARTMSRVDYLAREIDSLKHTRVHERARLGNDYGK